MSTIKSRRSVYAKQQLIDAICAVIEDSDEHFSSFSHRNTTNLTSTPSTATNQTSSRSAVRSIIPFYSQITNVSVQPTSVKLNSSIRVERKFGEDITNGNLLQELKKQAEEEKDKMMKNHVVQPPHRLPEKRY
ncbi:unnamed protein product [Rotaria sordida]|uniref:Uncharacterized protein n=1 Tax=Rotaria sordida TaxID=392033 RepID=A0A819DND6_9BILA|nr:unnamed protein product [Rotaria sordida]